MSRHLGTDKDIEKYARRLRKIGWVVELTSGNHLRWVPPGGDFTYVSPLTGNRHTLKRLKAAFKRAGYEVP